MKDIFIASGEEIAEWLHDTYEELSKEKGWETQKITRVKFEDLPESNKSVMLNLAQCIQVAIAISLGIHNCRSCMVELKGFANTNNQEKKE